MTPMNNDTTTNPATQAGSSPEGEKGGPVALTLGTRVRGTSATRSFGRTGTIVRVIDADGARGGVFHVKWDGERRPAAQGWELGDQLTPYPNNNTTMEATAMFKLGDKVQTVKSGRTGRVCHTYREFDGSQSMFVRMDDTGRKGHFRANDVEFVGTPRTPRNLPHARAW